MYATNTSDEPVFLPLAFLSTAKNTATITMLKGTRLTVGLDVELILEYQGLWEVLMTAIMNLLVNFKTDY